MAVVIRPAVLEDAALLENLGARTFRETFEPHCSARDLAAFLANTYGEAKQRTELADPSRPALVLEIDGVPAGYAQLRLGHREPCIRQERPVELQRIYVLRTHHGGGHGAALMQAALGAARAWGADLIWLGVWEYNHKALAFYARFGFKEVGDHLFKLGRRSDRDVILAMELP